MTRLALLALLSHWRRRKAQLLTLVLGLALATALWTGVQALNTEARAAYERAGQDISAAALPRILGQAAPTWADFITLRRAGWLVTPIVEGRIELAGQSVRLLGLDPLTAPASLRPAALSPSALSASTLSRGQAATPAGSGGALWLAAPALAAQIGAQPAGDLPPDLLVTDVREAQRLLGLGEEVSRLAVLPEQPLRQIPLADLGPWRRAPAEPQPDLSQMTGTFHLNLTAFGLLAFAVGLFVVQGTIGLAFEERRQILRTLRALGVPLSRLCLALGAELTLLALGGGLAGVALGGVLAALLLPDVAASLSGLYGAALPAVLSIRPEWWASGLAIALAGTWLAGASALWSLSRLPLLTPARPRAWALASRRRARGLAAAGLGLLLVSAVLLAFAKGLIAGFAALAALMLGAALLLPYALGQVLNAGQARSRGLMSRWLWADTAQQVPGLSLALAALLLALAANIGVSTMVGSFRTTFVSWISLRLSSDLYVIAADEDEALRFQAWAGPKTDAVLPNWGAGAVIGGQSTELKGLTDHPIYRSHWPLLAAAPGAWDSLARQDGVMISEQLAHRLDLTPGDLLALPQGERPVLAVYADYGNPRGQVLMALPELLEHFPQADKLRFGLRTAPGAAEDLRSAMVTEFGLHPEQITDQAAQKRAAIAIFDRTFLITGALNILTLAVAAFAMFTSLLALARMRLPQLAPVWAMGVTRRQLALLDLGRSLLLALITWVLALPLGLALAWALLARINVAAFGWRLPLTVDPASLAALLGGALLAALVAALIPALNLARLPPSHLLRVFSGEK